MSVNACDAKVSEFPGRAKGFSLERYAGNPIISPNPANEWEALITANPAAWYDEDSKTVIMLYRAAGNDLVHKIYLGLATSKDGFNFTRASDKPAFSPSEIGFDGGCVEDPRLIKIGEWYYVTYATRPFSTGQYWIPDRNGFKRPPMPDDAPAILRWNLTSTMLAMTKDFKTWIRAGRMTNPGVDDRDAYIFPEKINGKYYMIHRPHHWTGPEYGTMYPAMWLSSGTDLLVWGDPKLLAKAEYEWENNKIGGNTPPIKTRLGWLTLYHAVGTDKKYRLGALLMDLENPSIVRYRTKGWIFQPETDYECVGPYPGVCFPCGKVVIDGKIIVYYGGADKYVGAATCQLEDLLQYMAQCPVTR